MRRTRFAAPATADRGDPREAPVYPGQDAGACPEIRSMSGRSRGPLCSLLQPWGSSSPRWPPPISPTRPRSPQKYAPVVRLVEQPEECGPASPYDPLDVDVLFGEPTVALRGPWNRTDLVKIGPQGDGSRRPVRVPPRLPRRRARSRMRLRALEPTAHRREQADGLRPRRTGIPATRGSSRSSTGSSTPSTTSTTRTRATGR